MDIGKLKNNISYYEGYEGEPEVVVALKGAEDITLHIWDGYFDDMFSTPLNRNGSWSGFTRDYQECVGAWGETAFTEIKNPEEYLADIKLYEGRKFEYEETGEVTLMLIQLLEYAVHNKMEVEVYIK